MDWVQLARYKLHWKLVCRKYGNTLSFSTARKKIIQQHSDYQLTKNVCARCSL
jgi:ribosomal protein L40E